MLALLEMTSVKLDHAQVRQEHHGEALVPAIDLKFTWLTNNRSLDMIHPDLREYLFCKLSKKALLKRQVAKPEGEQDDLELPVDDELPNVRFTKLKYPLKWEYEAQGFTCTVDYGLGGKSNIVLKLCKMKDIKVAPIEGGSVEIEWTVSSAADISESIAGKLGLQQQREVHIELTPPEEYEAGQHIGPEGDWPFPELEKPAKEKGKGKSDGKGATETFLDAHGA